MGMLKKLLDSLPPEETNSGNVQKTEKKSTAEPIFLGMQGGKTTPSKYEVYKSEDAEAAKEFLLTKKVTEDQYYIIVETPRPGIGAWTKIGLYLERLPPPANRSLQGGMRGRLISSNGTTSLELAEG